MPRCHPTKARRWAFNLEGAVENICLPGFILGSGNQCRAFGLLPLARVGVSAEKIPDVRVLRVDHFGDVPLVEEIGGDHRPLKQIGYLRMRQCRERLEAGRVDFLDAFGRQHAAITREDDIAGPVLARRAELQILFAQGSPIALEQHRDVLNDLRGNFGMLAIVRCLTLPPFTITLSDKKVTDSRTKYLGQPRVTPPS